MLARLICISALLIPAAVSADSSGAPGRVVEITVNTEGSDNFSQFRGSVTLKSGAKKKGKSKSKSKGIKTTYKWGGSACPGKDLTEHQVQLLMGAFHDRARTAVLPRFKNGQGGAKCLVSFSIRGGAGLWNGVDNPPALLPPS